MHIVFDVEYDTDGSIFGRHTIDTDDGVALQTLKNIRDGKLPIEGTGWDVLSSHPDHIGETRFEAVIAEIVRLDHEESRAILGV